MPVNTNANIVFFGDRNNRKQMILGIPAESTADKPGILMLQSVNDSGEVTSRYLWFDQTGNLRYGDTIPTYEDVGGAIIPYVARAKYVFATDGGSVGNIVPVINTVIPANAIVFDGVINTLTNPTSSGSATIAIGTTAGSSGTSILEATAYNSFSTSSIIRSEAHTTPFKMSANGQIQLTIASAALTAGVIEVSVMYVIASA